VVILREEVCVVLSKCLVTGSVCHYVVIFDMTSLGYTSKATIYPKLCLELAPGKAEFDKLTWAAFHLLLALPSSPAIQDSGSSPSPNVWPLSQQAHSQKDGSKLIHTRAEGLLLASAGLPLPLVPVFRHNY